MKGTSKAVLLSGLYFIINAQAAEVDIQDCLDGSGILSDTNGLHCVTASPPPDPDPDSPCGNLIFSTNAFGWDIWPLDGELDSHTMACTSPGPGCSVWNEPGGGNAVNLSGFVMGYSESNGPYPNFSVANNIHINMQPGAEHNAIDVRHDNVCLTGVDASRVNVNGHSNVWINGEAQ